MISVGSTTTSFVRAVAPISSPDQPEGALTPDPRPGMSDSESDRRTREMFARLTPHDWATVSAAVGYKCGPDETGYIHPLQPIIACTIAFDRDGNSLKGPVTSDYVKTMGINDLAGSQVANATDYLNAGRADTRSTDYSDLIADAIAHFHTKAHEATAAEGQQRLLSINLLAD